MGAEGRGAGEKRAGNPPADEQLLPRLRRPLGRDDGAIGSGWKYRRRLGSGSRGKNASMVRSMHVLRAVAVLAIVVFVAAACSKGNNNNSSAAPQTEPPTATPGVQSVGNFGLVGTVNHAFEGVGPPVQIALAGISVTPTPGVSGPSGTAGTSSGARATQQGVMRITLENVSSPLHDKCGVSAGDKINVFWLTDTQFDTTLLSGSSLESSLEGRKIGVAGSIFVTGSSDQSNTNLGLPSPSTTPSTSVGP